MITITFPNREAEKRAVGYLLGRFSGRILKTGEHIVPEAALEALAMQGIQFTVLGKTTYEQHFECDSRYSSRCSLMTAEKSQWIYFRTLFSKL